MTMIDKILLICLRRTAKGNDLKYGRQEIQEQKEIP